MVAEDVSHVIEVETYRHDQFPHPQFRSLGDNVFGFAIAENPYLFSLELVHNPLYSSPITKLGHRKESHSLLLRP